MRPDPVENGLQPREVLASAERHFLRPDALRSVGPRGVDVCQEAIKEPVVFIAVTADRVDDLGLAGFRNITRLFLKGRVKPPAMLKELRPRALALAEEGELRGRVLALEALLHFLRGDHRVIVVGEDPP